MDPKSGNPTQPAAILVRPLAKRCPEHITPEFGNYAPPLPIRSCICRRSRTITDFQGPSSFSMSTYQSTIGYSSIRTPCESSEVLVRMRGNPEPA